jgi:DNA-binding PadR family transcriptional regulator
MWPFSIFRKLRKRRERREAMVLGTLVAYGELSGFQLHDRSGVPIHVLYPTLDRLEREGRVTSRWGEATPERGGHRPRLYSLAHSSP